MKQIWKCDFCSKTTVNESSMVSHERDCLFNPINKSCNSCFLYMGDLMCRLSLSNFEVANAEHNGNCRYWREESEL